VADFMLFRPCQTLPIFCCNGAIDDWAWFQQITRTAEHVPASEKQSETRTVLNPQMPSNKVITYWQMTRFLRYCSILTGAEIKLNIMARRKVNRNGNGPAIKRVLRHKDSREYFKDGNWTSDPNEADSFMDVVEVAQTCARYQLTDVELAVRFEAGCDVFCTSIR
jgi:hypothetical protein